MNMKRIKKKKQFDETVVWNVRAAVDGMHSLLYTPKTIHVPYASRGGMRQKGDKERETYASEGIILRERLMRSSCARDAAVLGWNCDYGRHSLITEQRPFVAR